MKSGTHFSELLLFLVLLTMLAFATFMSAKHNDSLASKGMEFTGQALAALLTLMVASKQSPPAAGTTTSTTTTNTASVAPLPPPPPENMLPAPPPEVPHVG